MGWDADLRYQGNVLATTGVLQRSLPEKLFGDRKIFNTYQMRKEELQSSLTR